MCGKFTQMVAWAKLVRLADLIAAPASPAETVTPMRDAAVIRRSADGRRETVRMRWGFIPAWAKDPFGAPHIHARAEDIETKPTFKDAFFARRGLIVVATFNEGRDVTPTKREQFVITPNDGMPVAIAVIWDRWGEPHAGGLLTFAMLTVPANALITPVTDRMPAVLPPEHWAQWLGEEPATVDELKAMLVPFEGDWTLRPQDARPSKPSKPKPDPPQGELF